MSIFNDVFIKKPGRSLFNLSHEKKFTGNFGYLYPFLVIDAVPGDTFKMSCEMLVRTAPLIAPVMHRVNVKVNYFFVPHRLVWTDWDEFITGVNQISDPTNVSLDNPYFNEPSNPVKPFTTLTNIANRDVNLIKDGSLMDFLGFPTLRPNATYDSLANFNIDLLPFYSYYKIYCDWYRNQNVEGGYEGAHESGEHVDDASLYFELRQRAYEKDYFTSALPFAQRGDAVQLPIQTSSSITFDKSGKTYIKNTDGIAGLHTNIGARPDGRLQDRDSSTPVNVDNSSNLKVSNTAIGTINDLRIATRIQRWLEKNARVGGRYIEQILAHFGVHSSDARLQRAEYLGGYTCPIVISDVEQTSATVGTSVSGTDTPQGNLSGKGTAYGSSQPVKCFCEEHGFIFGILSILPRTSYQDMLPRMYTRSTRYDYYFPEFANLGEQEVNARELHYDLSSASNSTGRFGFQERYCEYKYIPSSVHGEFKGNLSFWHLGRQFSTTPTLNRTFVTVKDDASINRVFAVTDSNVSDHFYIDLWNNVTAMRPMPKQAIPTL